MSKSQPEPTAPAPEIITLQGFECLWRDSDAYFTAEEIGKQLGYAEPGDSINKLYSRNVQELQEYVTTVKLTAVDGKLREHRVFSEEGVYILTFLAQTDKAREFRRQVAALLKHLRRQKLREARAEGIMAALNLNEKLHANIRLVTRYRSVGLTTTEIGKLMDCDYTWVNKVMVKARALGLEVR